MEFILFLIVGGIIYSVIENYFKNNATPKTDIHRQENNLSNSNTKPAVKTEVAESKKETQTIINNYYTQNNIYVQQNNYTKKSKSEDENKDHSEKVWKKLGYRVKGGETYAYKFYGNKIFTPDQVEKIGSYEIRYSETGLTKKLLNVTGSKSHTKDILVDNYGLSESKAQRLINSL